MKYISEIIELGKQADFESVSLTHMIFFCFLASRAKIMLASFSDAILCTCCVLVYIIAMLDLQNSQIDPQSISLWHSSRSNDAS